MLRRLGVLWVAGAIAVALLLGACATVEDTGPAPAQVTAFSANGPRPGLPRGWQAFIITRAKAPTQYELVVDAATDRVVLHAMATKAATGLRHRLDVDPAVSPRIAWQWRVLRQVDGADVTDRYADDAPVRLLLFFDGDADSLPARERALRETAKLLTGQPVPYATMMYVWDPRATVGQVVPSAHSRQVKLIVAGSGNDRLGQWKAFERNYVEDYTRAFGKPPQRLIGVGVLTDTDNTGVMIEAFYGDILLKGRDR
jgi:hypothetical protein